MIGRMILQITWNCVAPSNRLRKKRMTTALLFSTGLGARPQAHRWGARQAPLVAELRWRRAGRALGETIAGRSYGLRGEVANSHQVVRREGEREHPVHAARTPMPCLAHQSHRLEPAEDLLDALAPALAERIAGVARGAAVDRAGAVGRVLCHVRRHAQQPDRGDEIASVVAL